MRVVITETNGKYQARIQAGFFCFWRTTATTGEFDSLPGLLTDMAGWCAQLLRARGGARWTRQQRRAMARRMAKTIG